jgi:hypothetical protein
MSIKYLDELENILEQHNIPKSDICIVGSSVLAKLNLRENNDIDIIIKKDIRAKLFPMTTHQISENIELVSFGWLPNKKIDDDLLIDDKKFHDLINGFKIVKLEMVLARKEQTKVEKDLKDIESIKKYILDTNYDFNKNLYQQSKDTIDITRKILQKIKNRLRKYYKKYKNLQWTYKANSDLIIMQNTEKLLAYQYRKNMFNRYDIIIRYLAIEEYFGKNNYGYNLYKKMQEKRGFSQRIDHKKVDDSLKKFLSLINNIQKNGLDECSAISISKNQELIDGSHRLATALYFNEKLIPLKLNRYKYDTSYGLEWFKEKDFTKDELNLIEQKRKDIFYEKGVYFQIILWPPIQSYFEEIKNSLKLKYNLLDSYEIEFDDKEKFKEFTFGMYESDDIDEWKIEKKLSGFEQHHLKIKVIEIGIINPKFRKKELNNHDISQEVEAIKKLYRNLYKDKVENYFYDIIMHIGDNYHHTREIAKVLKRYK